MNNTCNNQIIYNKYSHTLTILLNKIILKGLKFRRKTIDKTMIVIVNDLFVNIKTNISVKLN